MLKVVEKTKLWIAISLTVIIIGLGFMLVKGLNYGIDFKGGTVVTVDMGKTFNKENVDKIPNKYIKDRYLSKSVNDAKEYEITIESTVATDKNIESILNDIKKEYKLKDKAVLSQESLGASIGKELKVNALWSLLFANLAILIYVGIRFEFNFAASAILALVHDILITLSIYAIFQIPINSPFIAAVLTIVGYSINDTIVVFDRIRENQKKKRNMDLGELANISITETLTRSINTVVTVLIMLLCVYIFVPSVREFSFPMLIGIASGSYSSICMASPIWVLLKKRNKKGKKAIA